MMKKWIFIGVVLLLLMIVSANSVFILEEGQLALIQRFGRVQAIYVKELSAELEGQLVEDDQNLPVHTGTGLKFKLPFVDNVIKYSAKLNPYETLTRNVTTSDKRVLYFDNNAQWRIENPLRFYKVANSVNEATKRIDDILYSRMNERVGKMVSHTLITDKEEVGAMLTELSETVSHDCASFGVSVIDVRIKRTDLPSETFDSIYNRMNSEREKIAAQYRSEGEEQSIIIRSATDRQVISITSEAARQAEILKGEADSTAAAIYNEAYGNSPEFFEFYNLLDTYRVAVGSRSTMVIPLDSPFAKYLLGIPTQAVQSNQSNGNQNNGNNNITPDD